MSFFILPSVLNSSLHFLWWSSPSDLMSSYILLRLILTKRTQRGSQTLKCVYMSHMTYQTESQRRMSKTILQPTMTTKPSGHISNTLAIFHQRMRTAFTYVGPYQTYDVRPSLGWTRKDHISNMYKMCNVKQNQKMLEAILTRGSLEELNRIKKCSWMRG